MEKKMSKFQKDFCGANRTEKCINICGNVKDKVVSFDGTGYSSLTEFATDFYKANNYEDIRYYSPAMGYSDHIFDENDEIQGNHRRKTLIAPLAAKITETARLQTPVVWIIEDASYLCMSNEHLGHEEHFAWLAIRRAIETAPRSHRFVFLFEKSCDMNRFTEPFKTLFFSKPDHTQRKQFTAEYFPGLDNTALEFVADRTDGLMLSKMDDIFYNAATIRQDADKDLLKTVIDDFLYGSSENPWEEVDEEKLEGLESKLNEWVLGQEEAVNVVSDTIKSACAGLTSVLSGNKAPKGISVFAGTTGVGKTELAKSISKFVFGDEDSVIRIDANEYGKDHNCDRLVGSPPGYVGYEAGGQLTNAVKEKPFCVLLVEEIDKASPKFWDYFMTILQDGRLTSGQGETVMFNNCYIIFTTNLGAAEAAKCDDAEERREILYKEIEKFFLKIKRKEIFGRLKHSIVPFNMIDEDVAREIITKRLDKISENSLNENKVKLIFSDAVAESLAQRFGHSSEYGGRDTINTLNDALRENMTRIYTKHRKPGTVITIYAVEYDAENNAIFQYSVEYNGMPSAAPVAYPPLNPGTGTANNETAATCAAPQRRVRRTAVIS